jgi:uncharacterized protein YprB with RNaseH-like and TPR domain
MIESTFQLVPGVGPVRERLLWNSGVTCWDRLGDDGAAALLSRRTDAPLRATVTASRMALERGDVDRLAAALPASQHWRLFEAFGAEAAYLDIETGDDVWGRQSISAIGILDSAGPRLLLAGRDLDLFPEVARGWSMLVTFNGLSFDVPTLRRAFPEWTPPACHVDLRHVLARLGHHGGLKRIEREVSALNLARPDHLRGITGWDACDLFRRGRDGNTRALRLFAEYNLYDVINLRTLMAYAYNANVAAEVARAPGLGTRVPVLPVPGRGDVLYDVSKILLAL